MSADTDTEISAETDTETDNFPSLVPNSRYQYASLIAGGLGKATSTKHAHNHRNVL